MYINKLCLFLLQNLSETTAKSGDLLG